MFTIVILGPICSRAVGGCRVSQESIEKQERGLPPGDLLIVLSVPTLAPQTTSAKNEIHGAARIRLPQTRIAQGLGGSR
jgi:hypothetical protein